MRGTQTAVSVAADLPDGVTAEAIQLQVEKICRSRGFAHSERLSGFLRFTVDHALLGEPEQLKEYSVGVQVCHRKDTYDPRIDPIVRVEARRLRARLADYYAGEGHDDPIVIEFTKGGYVPTFRRPEAKRSEAPGDVAATASPTSRSRRRWLLSLIPAFAIAALLWIFAGRTVTPVPAPAAPSPSVALLPVVSLGESDQNGYFAQGLSEELISALTKTHEIRVVAPSSLFEVKRMTAELQGVRQNLEVDTVLQSSVRTAGERVRVTAHLTRAADGSSIWAETYERKVGDTFSVQEELAHNIVAALRHQLLGSPGSLLATSRPENPEAYNLCLKGRYHWNKRTEDGMKIALDCFRQAIAKDPKYAKGYVGLADALATLGNYGVLTPQGSMPQAQAAAQKALQLEPEMAEALISAAFVHSIYDWNWKTAEREFRRALELQPAYAMGRKWYATAFLLSLGRIEEAIGELKRAQELDPLSPVLRTSLGYAFYAARQYDLAVHQSRESLEMHPGFYLEYWNLGLALEQQLELGEAVAALEKADTLAEGSPYVLGSLGHAYAIAGRGNDAETVLLELKRLSHERYISPVDLALVELALGRNEVALRQLEEAFEQRCTALVSIKIDPRFDPIRQAPAFVVLLKRMGLE